MDHVDQSPASGSTQAPLRVIDVCKTYSRGGHAVRALDGVSLDVQRGSLLAIMGASGSGKSTLLHLMAGLAKADAGQVLAADCDLATMGDKALTLYRRRQIGLVFQAFNLIPTLTAEENLTLPLALDGRADEADAKADQLFDTLGIAHRRTHKPDALSGGEQQRIAIGRALVTDPAVILADEPTGNLDSANSRQVCELLRDLAQFHNKTIVLVTHEPSVAAYATDVAILRDGKLVERFENDDPEADAVAARYAAAC